MRQKQIWTELAWLIAHDGEPLASDAADTFCDLVERRFAGEPMQYITGEAEFYGLPFRVNRDVLIPRPETEHLVEKAMALAADFAQAANRGRGHGLGRDRRCAGARAAFAQITATDISPAALAVAKMNAARNGVADRIRFLEGDLLEPVAGEQFDIVVSNPPYVPESDRNTLDVEVRDYEPAQALFAGEDGLAIYRRLIPAAFGALGPVDLCARDRLRSARSDAALLAAAGFSRSNSPPICRAFPAWPLRGVRDVRGLPLPGNFPWPTSQMVFMPGRSCSVPCRSRDLCRRAAW